jgi:hypothetical protein
MSATSLDVFDKTLQTTNIWLNEICDTLGPDRRGAWKVLSVVLHKLLDHLPPAAHLGTQRLQGFGAPPQPPAMIRGE